MQLDEKNDFRHLKHIRQMLDPYRLEWKLCIEPRLFEQVAPQLRTRD